MHCFMPMVYVNLMRVRDVFLMIWLFETWLLEARCPRALLVVDFPGRLWPFLANWGWNGVKPDPMTVSSILPSRSVLKDLQSGKASSYWFDLFL
jgi:hypothetical protein